jgi:ketosteroid isomerase-like protein
MKFILPIVVSGFVALSGCSRTLEQSHATDLAAITAFNQKYLKAINDGDGAALSALTDDDHIMISPNRAPVEGKAANDRANSQAFQRFRISEQWTVRETVIDGDLAYQRGLFTVSATPKSGGAERTTRGNFLRIYRRQPDGSWRMTRDMFSSDQPQEAPQPPSQP